MNRIIKFRAWHKQKHVMATVDDLHIGMWVFMTYSDGSADSHVALECIELMQDTGLKDNHGTEVYESDLVLWDGDTYEVQWEDAHWLLRRPKFPQETPWYLGTAKNFEVIGNIWGNEDLLK